MDSFILMSSVFVLALLLRFPIAIAIGFGIAVALLRDDVPLEFVSQMAFAGLDNYTFLAIPMFILESTEDHGPPGHTLQNRTLH